MWPDLVTCSCICHSVPQSCSCFCIFRIVTNVPPMPSFQFLLNMQIGATGVCPLLPICKPLAKLGKSFIKQRRWRWMMMMMMKCLHRLWSCLCPTVGQTEALGDGSGRVGVCRAQECRKACLSEPVAAMPVPVPEWPTWPLSLTPFSSSSGLSSLSPGTPSLFY